MKVTCTRKLHFDAGHRVMGHENKCAHLHGHSYQVLLEAESILTESELDSVGRVVDFGRIKEIYDPWIQEHWDHGFLLHIQDVDAIDRIQGFETGVTTQKLYLLDSNPTAENIGIFLLTSPNFVTQLQVYGVRIKSVTVHETSNCFAKVTR